MTTPAAALPVLPVGADDRSIVERVNALIRWFNRPDLFIPSYAADTGTGAAYAIAPSSDVKQYEVGQIYEFQAAHANTIGNPTLAVQGLPAGTITRINGTALSLGDIPAGPVAVICTSTTPTFTLLTPCNNVGATTFLGSDIALNNPALFFNGPNTGSVGASGQTWLLIAGGVIDSPSAATTGEFAIYNGTADIAAMTGVGPNAQWPAIATMATVVTLSGPMTFTLRAKGNAGTAVLRTTGLSTTPNKSTFITAVRLA